MTALKDGPPTEPEVLIEEARRRQRLRRQVLSAVLAAVVAGAAIFALASGGGGGSGGSPTARGGGSGGGMTATWRELTPPANAIPSWATISSVIRYRGELVAAGTMNGPRDLPSRFGCGRFCSTVVWASPTGARWRLVMAANIGTTGNLVTSSAGGLAVFSGGLSGLGGGPIGHSLMSLAAFERVLRGTGPLWTPAPARPGEGNVVTSFGDDGSRGLAPVGNSFDQWVRLTGRGLAWRFGYETFHYRASIRFHGRYVGIGNHADGVQILWSRDRRSWSKADVIVPNGDVAELSSNGSVAVLELIREQYPYRPAPIRLLFSTNGRQWHPAAVAGGAPTIAKTSGSLPTLLSVDGGFVAWNRTNGGIWWSQTGRLWSAVSESGMPPARLEPQGFTVVGRSLVVIEQGRHAISGRLGQQPGPTTFWRLTLSHP